MGGNVNFNYIKPKIFTALKNYNSEQFVKDLISGIIVAIIAMPLSIALAIASGVNPEQGLYTAVIAGFFISFLGGSSVQIGGPTAAFVIIIYGIVAEYGVAGLTVATIMAGLMLIAMGFKTWRFYKVHTQNNNCRFYIRNCCKHSSRANKRLLRTSDDIGTG